MSIAQEASVGAGLLNQEQPPPAIQLNPTCLKRSRSSRRAVSRISRAMSSMSPALSAIALPRSCGSCEVKGAKMSILAIQRWYTTSSLP